VCTCGPSSAGAAVALPCRWVARISSSPATHLPFLPLCLQGRHFISPLLPLSSPHSNPPSCVQSVSGVRGPPLGLVLSEAVGGGPSAHPEPT
jgi:hypothetical protein